MRLRGFRHVWLAPAGLTVAFAVLGVFLPRLALPGAVAAAASAAATAIAGVWSNRAADALGDARENRETLRGLVRLDARNRLPRVRDLRDPLDWGVHPAMPAPRTPAGGGSPAFVRRDVWETLNTALLRDRFVLIVGESTAGKSRMASEAVRELFPGFRLVEPLDRGGALAAARTAAANRRSVLWLDDLERFLGSGGLTGPMVGDILRGEDRYVVATMRSEEHAKFNGRTRSGFDGIARDAVRQGWDVLRLAARIDLHRFWSPAEVERAYRLDDRRLTEAAAQARHFGIAEYLSAAPKLREDWLDGWATGAHPRACALVFAAVDARRAGIHRPLPPSLLKEMHQPYLERRGGARLMPEPWDAATAWATSPLHATSSLLSRTGGGFLAFDYLIDAIDKERPPAAALDALVPFATPDEALDLGELAWGWSYLPQAKAAFARAADAGLVQAIRRQTHLIGSDSGGLAAAERFARESADRIAELRGPEHPDTFVVRGLVAEAIGSNGDPRAALARLRELIGQAKSVLGDTDRQTLLLRMAAAEQTGNSREPHGAAEQYLRIAAEFSRVYGTGEEEELDCLARGAAWLDQAGERTRAISILSQAVAELSQRDRAPGDQAVSLGYMLASSLARTGDHRAALAQWDRMIAEETREHGRTWSTCLDLRMGRAACVGQAGDPAEAVRLFEEISDDISSLEAQDSILSYAVRAEQAWWIGVAGRPTEAAERYLALAEEYGDERGHADRLVRQLVNNHDYWVGVTLPPAEAKKHFAALLGRLDEEPGPVLDIVAAVRREIASLGGREPAA